jgi:ribosomal protein L34
MAFLELRGSPVYDKDSGFRIRMRSLSGGRRLYARLVQKLWFGRRGLSDKSVYRCVSEYSAPHCVSEAVRPGGELPGRVRNAASIHMHQVPMDKTYQVIVETPDDFAVTFPNPNLPLFCRKGTEER